MTGTGSNAVSTAQQWEMVIATSKAKHAGTDAEIYCRVMTDGRKNSTSPVIRCSDEDKKSFKQGSKDTYKFTLPNALDGKVTTLQVWHSNKGNDWQPESISLSSREAKYDFYIPPKTEIKPDSPHSFYITKASLGTYKIAIKTSSSWGAGTDAKVVANVIGKKSSSNYHNLDNKGNDREKGNTDEYELKCHDLGEIQQIKLTLKKTKTLGGNWNIDSIVVSPDDGANKKYTFNVDAKNLTMKPGNTYTFSKPVVSTNDVESDDEDTVDPLPQPNEAKGNACQTKFEGVIYTADESGAGTDAKVEIWFTDLDGQVVGPLMITEVNGDTMERGHQNNITVELVEKLNGLAKIQLRQGGEGLASDWKLEKAVFKQVDLTTKKEGEAMNFYFNDWLSSRKIYDIVKSPADKVAELKTYTVTVKTTDKMWAGTDNTVKVNIVGSKGQSHARKLDNKYKNNFERGSTDTFELKLADLGTLKSLTLRKSGHDDWMVDSVSVKASDTNAVFAFNGQKITKCGHTITL